METRDKALLAVVQSASHVAHYPYAGTAPYLGALRHTPWAGVSFFDDNSVVELLPLLEAQMVDGIIFASGSLQSSSTRELLAQDDGHLLTLAQDSGVGILLLHQRVQSAIQVSLPGSRARCNFVVGPGTKLNIGASLEAEPAFRRHLAYAQTPTFEAYLNMDSAGNVVECWQSFEHLYQLQWRSILRVAATRERIITETVETSAPIVTCSLALDWNGQTLALASLMARTAVHRGLLVWTDSDFAEDQRALIRQAARNRQGTHFVFLNELPIEEGPTTREEHHLRPSDFFHNELFLPAMPYSKLNDRQEERVRRVLELGGSVSGLLVKANDEPGSPSLLLDMKGPLTYVARAQSLAQWFLRRRAAVISGLTFDVRAIAMAVLDIEDSFANRSAVPLGLGTEEVGPLVLHSVTNRLNDSCHVDNLITPTAACASALYAAGYDAEALLLVEWLSSALLDRERPHMWLESDIAFAEAQARIWLPVLRDPIAIGNWIDRYGASPTGNRYMSTAMSVIHSLTTGDSVVSSDMEFLRSFCCEVSAPLAMRADCARILMEAIAPSEFTGLEDVAHSLSAAVPMEHLAGDSALGIEATALSTGMLVRIESKLPLRVTVSGPQAQLPARSREVIYSSFEQEVLDSRETVSLLERRHRELDSRYRETLKLARSNRRLAKVWASLLLALYVVLLPLAIYLAVDLGWLSSDDSIVTFLTLLGGITVVVAIANWTGRLPFGDE
jgi:hypothetical protein